MKITVTENKTMGFFEYLLLMLIYLNYNKDVGAQWPLAIAVSLYCLNDLIDIATDLVKLFKNKKPEQTKNELP